MIIYCREKPKEVQIITTPKEKVLKGPKALGQEFHVTMQDKYGAERLNGFTWSAYFVVLAVNDTTTVNISPSKDIVGYAAGQTFQVKLNNGDIYSAQAVSYDAVSHLNGCHVVAYKPVLVLIYDPRDY